MHQSAYCAKLVQIFWPVTTIASFSTSPRARSAARSEPGARLGEALTPDVLAGQDLAQEGLALPILSLRDQDRAGQADADAQADEVGRPGARVLLAPDHLLENPELASTVGPRPGEARPASFEEPPLPPAREAHAFRRGVGSAVAGRPPSGGQVLLEPAPHLQSEARVLGALAKVHGGAARASAPASRRTRGSRSRTGSSPARRGAGRARAPPPDSGPSGSPDDPTRTSPCSSRACS